MLDIICIKGIILAVMLTVTFICTMIPLCFVRKIQSTQDTSQKTRYHRWLSFMSCSAGGVFMGTCIMDLFPDVQQQINFLLDQYPSQSNFPVAEFIVVFGFLFVLTMEQIVLDYKETSIILRPHEAQALLQSSEEEQSNLQLEHSLNSISDRPEMPPSMICESGSLVGGNNRGHSHLFGHSIHQDIASHSSLRSLLLLFALSLHSVFEGLAIGLQNTVDNAVSLFLVVIFHKGIIAFSLGLNMVQSKLTVPQMLLANGFFCVTAPFGTAIGMAVTEMQASVMEAILSGVLQGIACGTFLYVTFFEVLPHEMNSSSYRLVKLLFIILGFAAVSGVMYINPEQRTNSCPLQPSQVESGGT